MEKKIIGKKLVVWSEGLKVIFEVDFIFSFLFFFITVSIYVVK